jgi:hypothetical protein
MYILVHLCHTETNALIEVTGTQAETEHVWWVAVVAESGDVDERCNAGGAAFFAPATEEFQKAAHTIRSHVLFLRCP